MLNLYNKIGFNLKETPYIGDDGADGIGKDSKGNNIIIQTKRYSDNNIIGSPQIRDFIGSMRFYNVKQGIFLTTGYFSEPAINTVSQVKGDIQIELIDKDKLVKLLEKVYPKMK